MIDYTEDTKDTGEVNNWNVNVVVNNNVVSNVKNILVGLLFYFLVYWMY